MKRLEYVLSLLVALLVLAGAVVWTQASATVDATAVSCQAGKRSAPVLLKGMSIYRCPGGKRG